MALKFKNLKKGQSLWLIDEENQEPHQIIAGKWIDTGTRRFYKRDDKSSFIVSNLNLSGSLQNIPGKGLLWIPNNEGSEVCNESDVNWTTLGAKVRWKSKIYIIQDLLFLPEDYDQIFVFCCNNKDTKGFVIEVDMQTRYSMEKTFDNNTESAFLINNNYDKV